MPWAMVWKISLYMFLWWSMKSINSRIADFSNTLQLGCQLAQLKSASLGIGLYFFQIMLHLLKSSALALAEGKQIPPHRLQKTKFEIEKGVFGSELGVVASCVSVEHMPISRGMGGNAFFTPKSAKFCPKVALKNRCARLSVATKIIIIQIETDIRAELLENNIRLQNNKPPESKLFWKYFKILNMKRFKIVSSQKNI